MIADKVDATAKTTPESSTNGSRSHALTLPFHLYAYSILEVILLVGIPLPFFFQKFRLPTLSVLLDL